MEGVIQVCDEVCGKKRSMRSNGDTWCWNEDVKEAVSRSKDAHKMCRNSTVQNKKHKSTKNTATTVVLKTIREKVGGDAPRICAVTFSFCICGRCCQ